MISQTAEYALRAVACLAVHPADSQTTRQIAVTTRVPIPYLSKVIQSLARAGILHSQKGLHGGVRLIKLPETLSVYDVIQAVDPLQRITTCPLGLAAHGENLCPLHRRLDDAMAQVEKAFRDSMIADLLAEPATSVPFCDYLVACPTE